MVASPSIPAVNALGKFPGGTYSIAQAMSADGSVIVGVADKPGNTGRAFVWTSATGMVDIGVLPGNNFSQATGVSDDGTIVCGSSDTTAAHDAQRGFRWIRSTGLQTLGVAGQASSAALGISGDGNVIVGAAISSFVSGSHFHLARSIGGAGFTDLGLTPDGISGGQGTNENGSIIVGGATHVWYYTGAFHLLPDPPGATANGARGISRDGSIIFGDVTLSGGPPTFQGWLWSASGGYVFPDPYDDFIITGISADDNSIVGFIETTPDSSVFITSNRGGAQIFGFPDLGTYPNNSQRALAISGDGSTIAGFSAASGETGSPAGAYWPVVVPAYSRQPPYVRSIGVWLPGGNAEGVR